MKHYESQIFREHPSQKRTSNFKWVMFVLAFIALVIVTKQKILKIEVGLFDVTNPADEVIQDGFEFEPVEVTFRRYNLSYVHGNRVKGIFFVYTFILFLWFFIRVLFQGDKLVYYKHKRNFFSSPRNYSFSVHYPKRRALGATITYINLYVLQTSKAGQAVIRQGGVAYRNVTMDVTSYNTTQCRYTIRIYGVNKHKWVIFHSRAISDNMVLLSGISSSSCCLCTRHNWNKWNFAWNCFFFYL